ncbi:hypothetical protein PACTADRAFT_48957 [Pachysolen tannophilus NRRL Y-2460]|uniref:Phospholipase D1 n=1 Tax=Pachysolen tannophilus NRRL Y-2460 TaxID=669874 RepID=A0A1E4TZV8_PACTA|nr:hypothetical protein PACTADRAFT_48957 [Pachysolen tannophilus NRRL Y-2460]
MEDVQGSAESSTLKKVDSNFISSLFSKDGSKQQDDTNKIKSQNSDKNSTKNIDGSNDENEPIHTNGILNGTANSAANGTAKNLHTSDSNIQETDDNSSNDNDNDNDNTHNNTNTNNTNDLDNNHFEHPHIVPNSFQFRFLHSGEEDSHHREGRFSAETEHATGELPEADQQRQHILFGDYRDTLNRHETDPSPLNRNRTNERDVHEMGPANRLSEKIKPPLKSRRTHSFHNILYNGSNNDDEDFHNTWINRLSKITNTPNSKTFLGNNETPTNESRKWKEFKNSIKPAEELKRELDEKTKLRAEALISSLISGCPAALFASSIFLRDEHGTQRAPLLLSLLGFQLVDITKSRRSKHRKYKIELEYGVGENRLKWSIVKDIRDFAALHSRLKVLFFQSNAFNRNGKGVELAKMPKYDHHLRRSKSIISNINTNIGSTGNLVPSTHAIPPPSVRHDHAHDDTFSAITSISSNSAASSIRSRSRSFLGHLIDRVNSRSSHQGVNLEHQLKAAADVNELFRQSMEVYLNQLLITLTLRPQSNRVFQFFELSPIGVLLGNENGYQGKQGYLLVRNSAKAQGWRVGHLKFRELKDMVERHTTKWFLVRNSYIMYVNDIYSTTPLEVFLVDSSFKVDYIGDSTSSSTIHNVNANESDVEDYHSIIDEDLKASNLKQKAKQKAPYLTIKLENSERKLKMLARSEKQLKLWVKSINMMIAKTEWSQANRFGSFAPVRDNCFAQWFVDARDYMWACSSALEMAKETIYIHDWWLSPELYMRRPANGNQQWRIDRILKRKAEQGVKIFVIIYRNVGNTVVTDSLWTKHSLLDLHANIHVLRSPNQLLQNTYFWAHHEKLCIVDSTICFLGGIDLCYGRYDTADHVLSDDSLMAFASDLDANSKSDEAHIRFQNFPGKDYSNPRVKDFFNLDKPYESMYDRQSVPRMPWHDVHMISSGQIARDLSRHFVQRWNFLLRQKRPSRPTPLLLPPPNLTKEEIAKMGLAGTCEIQLLRSSCGWSLGLKEPEVSIQQAYLKIIETSEHFVYLENQFFVTSAAWDGVVIQNRIGDALVDRIIKAHNEGKPWRAVCVIPLMPGFESEVDRAEGSSVRVIMQCQFMSISRGSTSIFAKLRKVGIDPDDYIQFFSLRKWGRIGKDRTLITEQLYVHAKTIIADDRVALIGSANINERSMRGNRDSEVAAIVRDKELIDTVMNGKPYLASKFAHTLRMRLMREHLGVDVDILELVERRFGQLEKIARTDLGKLACTNSFSTEDDRILSAAVELASREILNQSHGTMRWKNFMDATGTDPNFEIPLEQEDLPEQFSKEKQQQPMPLYHSFNYRSGVDNVGIREKKPFSSDSRISNNAAHKDDVDGLGADHYKSKTYQKSTKKVTRLLKKWAYDAAFSKPTDVFLPHSNQVSEYLEDDSINYEEGFGRKLSAAEERILSMKNRERWDFLKRIAYFQRVATRQKFEEQEEDKRRANVGMAPKSSNSNTGVSGSSVVTSAIPLTEESHPVSDEFKKNSSEAGEWAGSVGSVPPSKAAENLYNGTGQTDYSGQVPIVSLDDNGVNDILQSLSTSGLPEKPIFIDPYNFEDPLDEDFYEDIWYEVASRNTRIYRAVFHSQPDNLVSTWKDYKDFSNMNSAFILAQEQEIKQRNERNDSSTPNDHRFERKVNLSDAERAYSSKVLGLPNENVNDSVSTSSVSSQGLQGEDNTRDSNPTSTSSSKSNIPLADNSEPVNYFPEDGDNKDNQQLPQINYNNHKISKKRIGTFASRHRRNLIGDRIYNHDTSEKLLSHIRGHLVIFPTEWLDKELESGNWFYNNDRIPPIEIYD